MSKNITLDDYIYSHIKRMEDLFVIRRLIKNWHDIPLYKTGIKKRIKLVLRTGEEYEIQNQEDYSAFWTSSTVMSRLLNLWLPKGKVEVNRDSIIVYYGDKKAMLLYSTPKEFVISTGAVRETRIDNQYSWLDVAGKDVIDIGGNVGDSAMYFALRGARHVYTFEPYPYLYNMAVRNVKNSGLNKSITVLNAGCGAEETKIKLIDELEGQAGGQLAESEKGREILITTLAKTIAKYKLKDACMKIDCEGCEYPIFLNSTTKTLRTFKQIVLEYHYGYINLEKKLIDSGFSVKHTRPKYTYHPELKQPNMFSGILYAELMENK